MKKLEWDSKFWGINVFHLDKLDFLDFTQLGEKYLLQVLASVDDLDFIHKLENKGFKFHESKVTLFKKRFDKTDLEGFSFKLLTPEDIDKYKKSFWDLFGSNSRFNIFSYKKVNDFYYTWLVNSMNGEMDDDCIGYFVNNELAGFVTYKIKDNAVVIGLLGVLPSFRGRGISQKLLNYVDNIAFDNSIGVSISTQGTNLTAINAYIKNGYYVESIKHWYYLFKGDLK